MCWLVIIAIYCVYRFFGRFIHSIIITFPFFSRCWGGNRAFNSFATSWSIAQTCKRNDEAHVYTNGNGMCFIYLSFLFTVLHIKKRMQTSCTIFILCIPSQRFKTLGHIASAYCVIYDRTGRRVVSAADDANIKVWCSESGKLLKTLRGHSVHMKIISCSFLFLLSPLVPAPPLFVLPFLYSLHDFTYIVVFCCSKRIRFIR